jgi:three-Cys-motif partner protein
LAADEQFFDEQTEASEVKSRIIEKYFDSWARIIVNTPSYTGKLLGYVDLYCGPGRYEDNQKSTPLLVLEKAIASSELRKRLVTLFNDEKPEYTARLEAEIEQLPGMDLLQNRPIVTCSPVGLDATKPIAGYGSIATFTFIDPFGYTGLTRALIAGVTSKWGCDCVFFFNYNRINQALVNDAFVPHMRALFGQETADQLYAELNAISSAGGSRVPHRRQTLILDKLAATIAQVSGPYVLPFMFKKGARTSHSIVFVTKHPRGYEVMKEIMYNESTTHDSGIASFGYSDADAATPYLNTFAFAFEDFKTSLCTKFAGQTLRMQDIYRQHNVGTPYISRNYKKGLNELEVEKRISAEPAFHTRKIQKGKRTFPDDTIVRFPARGS